MSVLSKVGVLLANKVGPWIKTTALPWIKKNWREVAIGAACFCLAWWLRGCL